MKTSLLIHRQIKHLVGKNHSISILSMPSWTLNRSLLSHDIFSMFDQNFKTFFAMEFLSTTKNPVDKHRIISDEKKHDFLGFSLSSHRVMTNGPCCDSYYLFRDSLQTVQQSQRHHLQVIKSQESVWHPTNKINWRRDTSNQKK